MKKHLLKLVLLVLLAPWVAEMKAQCPSEGNMCLLTILMEDSYGDGWNGASMAVYQGTTLRGTATLTGGETSGSLSMLVCPDSIRFVWIAGSYDDEISFVILNGNDDTIFSVSDASTISGQFATGFVICPACPRPISPSVVPSSTNAILSWIEIGDADSWEIEYDTVGFVRGTGITVTSFDTAYQLTNLIPNTAYDVYIRSLCGSDESTYLHFIFRTACVAVDSLPYVENFDGYTGSNISPCWKTGKNNQYNTISTTTTSSSSAPKALRFYNSGTSYYAYAAMPLFVRPLNELYLTFACASSTSGSSSLEVGVMTNPGDINTFQTIRTYLVQGASYASKTLYFENYSDTNLYIAFVVRGDYANVYLDDIRVDIIPDCSTPLNLQVEGIAGSSALVTWNSGDVGIPISYTFEYTEADNQNWIHETTTDPYYLLTGLSPQTKYYVRVKTSCENEDSFFLLDSLFTQCLIPLYNQIGNGTNANYTIPVNNYYNYTLTQEIYEASEMQGAQILAGMGFEYLGNQPTTLKSNVDIYLSHIQDTALTSSFIVDSLMTLVYSGNLNCTQGWNVFHFNTPFAYDGQNDLLVTIHDKSGAYNGSNYTFATHNIVQKARSANTDNSNYNPLNPPTGNALSYRNNVKFTFCDPISTCAPPNAFCVNIGIDQLELIWAAGNTESSWTVELWNQEDSSWTVVLTNTTNTSNIFTNLESGTEYRFRVTANCGGGESASCITTAKTKCAWIATFPYIENFDSYGIGNTIRPVCWPYGSTYSSVNPPYITDAYASSGTASIYMHSYMNNNSSYTYLATPIIDTTEHPFNTLQVRFKLLKENMNATHGIIVGVMTDPNDIQTFVPIDTAVITLVNIWEEFEIPLTSYAGRGAHIAFVSRRLNASDNYNTSYLDDVVIELIPSCSRPSNFIVNNIMETQVSVSWNSGATTGNWVIEYGPRGFTQGTGTMASSTVPSYTITGLNGSTPYDVYVRSICSTTDTSAWSFPFIIRTACTDITTLPYFDGFDTYTSLQPNCWTSITTYAYGGANPSISQNYAHSGSSSIYLQSYSGSYTYLATPLIDSTQFSLNQLQVTFDVLKNDNYSTNGLIVGVMSDPNNYSTFVPVDTIISFAENTWESFEIEFDNYVGNAHYVAFLSIPFPGNYSNSIYLENVKIEEIPACRRPVNLRGTHATATTVDISWQDRNGAAAWQIAYDTVEFPEGSGTIVSASSNPYTLTGLQPASNYYFRIRSVCSAIDTGLWSFVANTATSQNPATIPYSYNFEDPAEWANWQTNSNMNVNWYRDTADAAQGAYSMYVSNDQGVTRSTQQSTVNTVAYRDIDFGSTPTNYTLTFDWKAGGATAGNYDGLVILLEDPSIQVNSSSVSITSPWGNINAISRVGFVRNNLQLSQAAFELDTVSGIKRLAFYWFNQWNQVVGGPAAVDNI